MDDTNELRRSVIQREIDKQLHEQLAELQGDLMRGCEEKDSYEDIYSKMIVNSVVISVKITATMIMEALFDTGVWEPRPDDEMRKGLFVVVDGGKSREREKD